jgi:hypothetical protein
LKGGAIMKEIERLLLESNESLRSAYQIARRNGKDTNWQLFGNKLLVVLTMQHDLTNEIRKCAAEKCGVAALQTTNNARDATAEQTLCSTCYYMVVETSEVPPCRNCRTIRSLWRSAAAPVA